MKAQVRHGMPVTAAMRQRPASGGAAQFVRELVRASELVGFELTEFEAPSNPGRRTRAVQTVIRMIEPVFLAGADGGL
ncbi:MAG: hypothetical protein MN733_44105 [Nitrososphaera sp.]|nr:hypothetical protein [Nitrososphaera sp.]